MPAALEVSTRTSPSSPYLLVFQGRCCHTRYGCGIKLHPFWLCGWKKLARKLAASYRRSFLHTFKRSCPNAVWQCWCASSQGTMHICLLDLTWSYLYPLKSLFVCSGWSPSVVDLFLDFLGRRFEIRYNWPETAEEDATWHNATGRSAIADGIRIRSLSCHVIQIHTVSYDIRQCGRHHAKIANPQNIVRN